jgi:hypothetical protein
MLNAAKVEVIHDAWMVIKIPNSRIMRVSPFIGRIELIYGTNSMQSTPPGCFHHDSAPTNDKSVSLLHPSFSIVLLKRLKMLNFIE